MDSDTSNPIQQESEEVKIPRRFSWEVADLVRPIVVRRRQLWAAGIGFMLLVVISFIAWAVLFRPATGSELLDDVVAAAGGMENWNAIQTGSFTRVHTLYDDNGDIANSDTETFYFRKVGDYRLVIESSSDLGHVVIGRDDEGYWATKDGEVASPVAVARRLGMMCEDEYCTPDCAAGMAFYRFSLPFKLTDPGVIPANIGEDKLNGVPVQRLEVTFDPSIGKDRWVFYVDEETKLIRKIQHYGSVDSDTPPEEIYWSDHQEKFGITFSHRQSYYRSNGTKLEEYVVTDVDFETPVADDVFVRPEKRTVQTASLVF